MLNAWQLVEHSIHDVFDADRTRAIFLIGADFTAICESSQ
jgi:hypothetical protein